MFTLHCKSFCRNLFGCSMHFCICSTGKPLHAAGIENIFIKEVAAFNEILFNIFNNIFNFPLAFRISLSAKVYTEFALLSKFFKFRCEDDIAIVFRNSHQMILVQNNFMWHAAIETEGIMETSN